MSVRKNKQNENRFTVTTAALDLYDHTSVVIANPKFESAKALSNRIDYEASMIYHYCRSANEDYDNRKQDEAETRIKLQERALEQCKWLKTDIRLIQRKLHLRASKCTFWTGMVNTAMDLIKAWNAAEKRNYKDNYGL